VGAAGGRDGAGVTQAGEEVKCRPVQGGVPLVFCAEICIIGIAMRTTLDIDDKLLKEAKQLAAREHTSLTRLIEEGLAARLRTADRPPTEPGRVRLPVFAGRGGLRLKIKDAGSHQAILDALDEEDGLE